MSDNVAVFPVLAPWLRALTTKSSEPFVRNSEQMISYGLEVLRTLPADYHLRLYDDEAYRLQVERAFKRSAVDGNQLYWHSIAHYVEAYAAMSAWRAVETIESAVQLLNNRRLVPAAVLGRSLLELATAFITSANVAEKTIASLPQIRVDQVITSGELEKYFVRAIWGRRLENPPDYLKQTNVLTLIQRLSKNSKASDLLPKYEYLCEVAHPNFIGNLRFWSGEVRPNEDGSESFRLDRQSDATASPVAFEVVEKTLWALAWSAVSLRNGFHLCQEAVCEVLRRWPRQGA